MPESSLLSAQLRSPRKKVLYESQPDDDDAHTTDAFLEELVVNATVLCRSYPQVVWASLPVNQQLSTVTLVATATYSLTQGRLSPAQLLWIQLLLAAAGAALFCICAAVLRRRGQAVLSIQTKPTSAGKNVSPPCAAAHPGSSNGCWQPVGLANASTTCPGLRLNSSRSRSRRSAQRALWREHLLHQVLSNLVPALRTAALFVSGTAALSPLYATLAQSISTDSVVFLSAVLFTVHLFLWDYSFAGRVQGRAMGISLGCAMLASIVCASRAGSAPAAFAQVLLALEAFVLFPQLRFTLAQASPSAHLLLTLGLATCALTLLWPLSVLLASSFVSGTLFVSLICPMWLVRVGKFKAQINGPWDEAVPRLSREVRVRVASPRTQLPHLAAPRGARRDELFYTGMDGVQGLSLQALGGCGTARMNKNGNVYRGNYREG